MEGTKYKQYVFERKLGEGGMADVYLAMDTQLNHNVAIKKLKDEFVHFPNIKNRFIAEAKSMFQMNHINVTKVYSLIDDDGFVAAVMEYVPGLTLDEFRKVNSILDFETIKILLSQMVDALDYVHKHGLIHRDIKPSNFIVNSDLQLKLLDFGIAKNLSAENLHYTSTGIAQQMGTPLYMSPEQIKTPNAISSLTDIYSLGVVLYYIVVGKNPYDSNNITLFELQSKIVHENLPLTGTSWDKIIQRSTNKKESDRYQKVSEIKQDIGNEDLDRTKVDTTIQGGHTAGFNRTRKLKNRINSGKYKIIGFISILALGLIIYGLAGESEEEQKMHAEETVTAFVKDLDLDIRNKKIYPNVEQINGALYYLREFNITSTSIEKNGDITVHAEYNRGGSLSNSKFIVRKVDDSYQIIKSIGISGYYDTPLLKYCLRKGYLKIDGADDKVIGKVCGKYEYDFNWQVDNLIDHIEENVYMEKGSSNLTRGYGGGYASGEVTIFNNTLYTIPSFAIECKVVLIDGSDNIVAEEVLSLMKALEPFGKVSKSVYFTYVPSSTRSYKINTKVVSRNAIEKFIAEN
jgi:hypothetical protein